MTLLVVVIAFFVASSFDFVSSFHHASHSKTSTIRRSLDMIHFNENIGSLDSVLYDMPVSNNGARVRMLLKAKGLLDKDSGHNIVIRLLINLPV